MMRKVSLLGLALALIPAAPASASHSVRIKPDRMTVLTCAAETYEATQAEVITRVDGKREWMLVSGIRHPNRQGTLATFRRQGGGGGLARLYSTPDGERLVVSNQGAYPILVRNPCPRT